MTEREQVIAELLYLKHDCLEGSATDQTLDKAIALLKEQEPRVMTLEEVLNADDYLWTEIWTPRNKKWSLIYARVRKCIDEELLNLQEDSGIEWTRLVCDYGMKGLLDCGWRCWTSRPTLKRMQDTKWGVEAE